MLDPLTSASELPANSHQVLDFLIGFGYPIVNFPVDLLLPMPEYMPLPNLGLPEPNVSPSSIRAFFGTALWARNLIGG